MFLEYWDSILIVRGVDTFSVLHSALEHNLSGPLNNF